MSLFQESLLTKLEDSKSDLVCNDYDEKGTVNDKFISERVFLSNVDSYHGRHIAAAIGRTISQLDENDDDEIGSLEERSSGNDNLVRNRLKYEIIGSVTDENFVIPNHVEEIIYYNEKSKILENIFNCKYIIYDISEDTSQVDEAAWAITALDEEFSKPFSNEKKKNAKLINYILISTVLTWAKTKPIDHNEPNVPITEDNYRMRKPHPNYKFHFNLEREVIRIGKKHKKFLKTIVIASGLVYGQEENLMGILFKLAWMNKTCPCFLPGNNTIPLLHVNDLARIICNLMELMPKKKWYIIAIEETAPTLKEIVKAISKELGAGEVTNFPKEEAPPIKEITLELYDHLTVDLNMSPKYILDDMDLEHVSEDNEMNFLNIIKETVTNFIESHGLKAIKIYINGPPLSGKTFLANKLCSYYQLHYLSYDTIIEDFSNRMTKLKKTSSKLKSREDYENTNESIEENVDEDIGDNEENENELVELFEQLEEAKLHDIIPDPGILNRPRELENSLDLKGSLKNFQERCKNLIHVTPSFIRTATIRVIKERLLSKPCQNQGYVLDGFPDTYDQAKVLFCINKDEDDKTEEEEEEDDDAPLPFAVDKRIMPDHIFNLIADDAILLYRGQNIPPEREMDTYCNEESLKKRIIDFRILNSDASTVMNFFLEMDKNQVDISVNNDERPLLEKAFKKMLNVVGKPCNFASQEIVDEKISKEEEALILLQKEELLQEKLKKDFKEKLDKRAQLEEWVIAKSATKKEEEDLLKAKTVPIRDYILMEIFPQLKEALVEIYRMKPIDPVEYLAEYLFTHHVDGKHFPPESNEVIEDNILACLGMVNNSRINEESM